MVFTGDDPWVEHARWSSRCEHVRNIKGENFIVSVQNKHQQVNENNYMKKNLI